MEDIARHEERGERVPERVVTAIVLGNGNGNGNGNWNENGD